MSDPSNYEILVVDDTPANLKLLSALLVEQGYRVRAASNGVVALRSVAFKAPDLILLDVRMPGMDGYEVCRQIKADPQQRMIPVIFVSALNETADKLKGFAAGGVDFVTKPVDPAEVLARVRTHLELLRLQRRQERIQIELAERVEERTEELKRTATELASALREKETLLKEIYHRVKNNLQVVSSLLTMQGARASDEARALLTESAARVRSIALVHEQLYRSATLSSIRYPAYVRQLVDHLMQTYDPLSHRVPIKVEIDDLNIGVGTAVPLGLVITELISNAYKHAFPGLATGEIRVSLRRLPKGLLRLVVQDSGCGLPPEPAASSSLGLNLVRMLADQLDGRLEVSSPGGACFTLTFTPEAQEVTFITPDEKSDARQAQASPP